MRKGKEALVLVAGGAGFIGSHLCELYLADGARVLCLDNLQTGSHQNLARFARDPRFSLIEADVALPLPEAVSASRWSAALVVNAACPASPPHYQADPQHTLLTSVVGTHGLLALAKRQGARFLMCSTSEVYGDPLVHPQVETYWGNVNPTGPRACYDEGKRAAETLCFDFLRRDGVDVRVARIFNTYGERMQVDDGRIVSNAVCQALTGADITIYGDGSQTRSFCYVADLADGLRRLAAHAGPVPGPVNLGNPAELTVRGLVDKVVALTGSRSRIVRRPLPVDDPTRRRPDIGVAAALLGWSPKVDLDAGLERTIRYFATQVPQGASTARDAATESVAV